MFSLSISTSPPWISYISCRNPTGKCSGYAYLFRFRRRLLRHVLYPPVPSVQRPLSIAQALLHAITVVLVLKLVVCESKLFHR
jgi:hypothetical protein